jgi:hypothetical protein
MPPTASEGAPWLDRHQRFTFHFTPTSCSWLNAVEGFFAKLTRRRLKRGVFISVVDLQAAINRFVVEHNAQPKPFRWTADPNKIIRAVRRGHQVLDSVHQVIFEGNLLCSKLKISGVQIAPLLSAGHIRRFCLNIETPTCRQRPGRAAEGSRVGWLRSLVREKRLEALAISPSEKRKFARAR